MEQLIHQAFMHVEGFSEQVQAGHYDLAGPDGEIILPGVWDVVVQPDWQITMHMWPMAEEKLEDKAPEIAIPPPLPSKPHKGGSSKGGSGKLFGFGGGGGSSKSKKKDRAGGGGGGGGPIVEVIDDAQPVSGGPEIMTVAPEVPRKPRSDSKAKRRSMGPTPFAMWAGGYGQVRRK